MKKHLVKLADHLDKKGFKKEADYVDWIIKKVGSESLSVDESIRVAEDMIVTMMSRIFSKAGSSVQLSNGSGLLNKQQIIDATIDGSPPLADTSDIYIGKRQWDYAKSNLPKIDSTSFSTHLNIRDIMISKGKQYFTILIKIGDDEYETAIVRGTALWDSNCKRNNKKWDEDYKYHPSEKGCVTVSLNVMKN